MSAKFLRPKGEIGGTGMEGYDSYDSHGKTDDPRSHNVDSTGQAVVSCYDALPGRAKPQGIWLAEFHGRIKTFAFV